MAGTGENVPGRTAPAAPPMRTTREIHTSRKECLPLWGLIRQDRRVRSDMLGKGPPPYIPLLVQVRDLRPQTMWRSEVCSGHNGRMCFVTESNDRRGLGLPREAASAALLRRPPHPSVSPGPSSQPPSVSGVLSPRDQNRSIGESPTLKIRGSEDLEAGANSLVDRSRGSSKRSRRVRTRGNVDPG
jgi:hypothetical protein